MVLLDGEAPARAAITAEKDRPLAGLGQLKHQIEHLALWTTAAMTRGTPGEAEPPVVQGSEAQRSGVFGRRFKRH